MRKNRFVIIAAVLAGLILLGVLVYRIPAVERRLSWRVDAAQAYLRGVINPAGAVPTPKSVFVPPTSEAEPSATPRPSPTVTPVPVETDIQPATPTAQPSPTPTAIPESVQLPAPDWVRQDWNNCGPAALTMYLRFYGWEGDQFEISDLLKPTRGDRNVNVEELDYYVRNYAGWLETMYRVGGDLETVKRFIAAGIPVIMEVSFYFEEPYWPDDDLWAAHYLLVTGYDDAAQTFTVQDTFRGPNRTVSYEQMQGDWQPFNYLFMLVYPPEQEPTVQAILGENWDEVTNRQNALALAQVETEADPENAYAWFNLGTNLLYFERYEEAAQAYDRARQIGWPQRMLRYQFGPFFAYFHTGRTEDLMALTEYALRVTPKSEEAHLWQGWGLYRQGDVNGAVAEFRKALEINPNYWDAQYALDFVLGQ